MQFPQNMKSLLYTQEAFCFPDVLMTFMIHISDCVIELDFELLFSFRLIGGDSLLWLAVWLLYFCLCQLLVFCLFLCFPFFYQVLSITAHTSIQRSIFLNAIAFGLQRSI